jgi:hypothetical protein
LRFSRVSAFCFCTISIIDAFGLTLLEKQQLLELMDRIEKRHAKASTIMESHAHGKLEMLSEKIPSQMLS